MCIRVWVPQVLIFKYIFILVDYKKRSISNATIVTRWDMSRKIVGIGKIEERNLKHQPHKIVFLSTSKYKKFHFFVVSLGYNILGSYHCIYCNRLGEDDFIILLYHVDDMLEVGPNKARIQEFACWSASRVSTSNSSKKVKYSNLLCLGKFASLKSCLLIPSCKPRGWSCLEYCTLRWVALCIMVYIRPDIDQIMRVISRCMENSSREYWSIVKRIFRYIKRNLGCCNIITKNKAWYQDLTTLLKNLQMREYEDKSSTSTRTYLGTYFHVIKGT